MADQAATQRDTLLREKQSLGFYVSGHPLERYGKDLKRFSIASTSELAGMAKWTKVRVAGMIENYRNRTFKGGGKIAFFELEDEGGRVDVKVSEKRIDAFAGVLGAGDPVLVEGKVSFPMTAEDEEDDGSPKRPTLLLDSAMPLAKAIEAEARSLAIRLVADRTRPEQLHGLADVLARSPGPCSVSVVIELAGGSEQK